MLSPVSAEKHCRPLASARIMCEEWATMAWAGALRGRGKQEAMEVGWAFGLEEDGGGWPPGGGPRGSVGIEDWIGASGWFGLPVGKVREVT
jgi:hypothetical protein